LRLIDIEVRSNETTMNRTPMGYTTNSGSARYNSATGTVNSQGTAFTVVGQQGRNEMLPPNTTEFAIDPEAKKTIRFGSVTLTILDADETSMRYSLASETKAQ